MFKRNLHYISVFLLYSIFAQKYWTICFLKHVTKVRMLVDSNFVHESKFCTIYNTKHSQLY